jgi:hydroxyacylglutathione hydrolase
LTEKLVKRVFGRLRQAAGSCEGAPRLTIQDLDLLRSPRALLLDLRTPHAFASGFIPGSVNLPEFASPDLLIAAQPLDLRSIYLLTDSPHAADRAAKFLERFHDIPIAGCFPASAVQHWQATRGALAMIECISADTLAVRLAAWKTVVADIRDAAVFRRAHIPESIRVPINNLTGALTGLPFQTSLSLICEIGTRCSFAASLLWKAGYRELAIVKGGFASYVEHGLPLRES